MGLFGKRKKKMKLHDFNGISLKVGDKVNALRYDLGESILEENDEGYVYKSLATGQTVSFAKMIDAHTKYQKVIKLD